MRRVIAPLVAAGIIIACSSGSSIKDPFVGLADASDGGPDSDALANDRGGFADADPTLGVPCADDSVCNDAIACTFDACDKTIGRCRHTPEHTKCADPLYCNGIEQCVPGLGCQAGAPVTCTDIDPCTIGHCNEETKACEKNLRDVDGDGDPDDRCSPSHDCNDQDPTVSSVASEICGNKVDDNCNGTIDETNCVTALGNLCANPISLVEGSNVVSTLGATLEGSSSCDVPTPSAARDVFGTFTVPTGGARDVEIWANTQGPAVAAAILSSCTGPGNERSCNYSGSWARTRARSLSPGTYLVRISTQGEASVDVRIVFLDPTTKPTNETCASPMPVSVGVPFNVTLVDATRELTSACYAMLGELTYAFTLTATSDVRIYGAATSGVGTPILSLRFPNCTQQSDELRCRSSTATALFARSLTPGTYILSVASHYPLDATVRIEASAPTAAPADQSCATAPTLAQNETTSITLADHEDAIKDGCTSGYPNAAYSMSIAQTSDVMLVGRFANIQAGGVSLDAPLCTTNARLACSVSGTPVRATVRGLPAGDYRVVMADMYGLTATITPFVRPALAPTAVTMSDTCATAVTIPEGGGFFTGDTTNALADYDHGCDSPTVPKAGANDQVLKLVLSQKKRVAFELSGSSFIPLLEVQKGPQCPGQIITGACYVGFNGYKSFLDLTLDAGTYFVFIDGYNMDKGAWSLNVHVINP